jgi:hypothetical protein
LRVTVVVRSVPGCPSDLARGWHGRRGRTWLTPGGDGHQLGPTLRLVIEDRLPCWQVLMGARRQAVSLASGSDAVTGWALPLVCGREERFCPRGVADQEGVSGSNPSWPRRSIWSKQNRWLVMTPFWTVAISQTRSLTALPERSPRWAGTAARYSSRQSTLRQSQCRPTHVCRPVQSCYREGVVDLLEVLNDLLATPELPLVGRDDNGIGSVEVCGSLQVALERRVGHGVHYPPSRRR